MFKVVPLPRTLSAAQRDIGSHEVPVRLDAVRDLGAQGGSDGREARIGLLTSALRDAEPRVRRAAALALADQGAAEAREALLSCLSDPELGVRQMVILALGEVCEPGDHEVMGRLCALLQAGDPAIRYQALSAYSGLARAGARGEILLATRDHDAEVRELALRLLSEILLVDRSLDPELAAALVLASRDSSPSVRTIAQVFCGEWGFDAARDEIVALAIRRRRAREARDEQLAIELCGRLALGAAAPGLARRAFGVFGVSLDPFRWTARAALSRLGDARATRRIEKGLGGRSFLERNLAVRAVGEAGLVSLRGRLEGLRGDGAAVDQEVLTEALAALEAS